jgi:TIR domain
MKVFISHQRADSELATRISSRLFSVHKIDTYLDVIDPSIAQGTSLADHVRAQLGKCTQLLAVVSDATRNSWWVPWEIGIATEKDYPLATYAESVTVVPEYMRRWPYLQTNADLDLYAAASKAANQTFVTARSQVITESVARSRSTQQFFQLLRSSLHQ